jgi:hypothetical protein
VHIPKYLNNVKLVENGLLGFNITRFYFLSQVPNIVISYKILFITLFYITLLQLSMFRWANYRFVIVLLIYATHLHRSQGGYILACLRSSLVEALLCMCPNLLYLLFFSIYKWEGRCIGLLIQFSVQQLAVCFFLVVDFHFYM